MRKRKQLVTLGLLATISVLTIITGCSRDPNVRKRKYLESGQRYFEQGRDREAMIQYMNALQVDPQYADAHYGLAQIELKRGAWNNARFELTRTVELQPDNLQAQLDLGNLYFGARDFEAAMAKAKLILAKDSNYVGAYVLKANVHAARDEREASLAAMQEAIARAPQRSELYLNLGTLQMKAEMPAEAEVSFRKAIELKPGSSGPLLALAGFYRARGRLAEAEQQYQLAIQAEPKQLSPRLELTRFYMWQNRRDLAEQLTRETAALKDVPEAKTVLVDFYAGLGEMDKALETASSLYRADGRDLSVKEAYVRMLLANRRFGEAADVNEEILNTDSKNVNALIAKAQIFNNTGRPTEAIGAVESALKLEPENALGHYVLGVSANLSGDAARAEKEWGEAASIRPSLVEAQQALASVALRNGDLDLLARVSEELVKAQPNIPDGYVLRALVAANRKEPAKAEADLEKAIAVAPRNPLGFTKLGVWRIEQKNYAAAEKLFEQALALDANAAEALQGLIKVHADILKNVPKALARVKRQIARSPSNSGYYLNLGMLQRQIQDSKSAEISLQKAIELDRHNGEAYVHLAELQAAGGHIDQAATTYENLIRSDPKHFRALTMLGSLEQSRANWQKAQALYEKALLLSPEYPPAANNLAYLLLEHGGNPDVALELALIARRNMPDSAATADTLAWAYYQKGIYPLAVDLLEECIRKSPQNPNYRYHLGLALQKQNEKTRARQQLEQVLKIDPKYPNAQEVRKALSELGS